MKFEERLKELIDEAEVPVELMPQNIAAMLKAKNAQSERSADKKNIKMSANVSAQRRTIIIRTAAAAAACAVFTAGMLAYNSRNEEQDQIEERIKYEAILPPPETYDDLYNIYTDIYLNGDGDNTEANGSNAGGNSSEEPIEYSGTAPEAPPDISAQDFSVSDADIVKCEGDYMYCLKDSTLYIVSMETMEVVSTIESSLDPPIEIYIEGDNIILISTETGERQAIGDVMEKAAGSADEAGDLPTGSDVPADDPDSIQPASYDPDLSGQELLNDKTGYDIQNQGNVSRTNTAVDIYNIRTPDAPILKASYKQNGSYTASRLVDGKLYMVTAYSDYRIKPLYEQADLDSFVPAYYINGEKFFIAAGDIIVPAGANSTDYTVISSINIDGEFSAAAKAVLGSSRNVYCSDEALYITGTGKTDMGYYTIISSFDLDENGIKYRASASVEGTILSRSSMNEYGGNFRIAVKNTDEDGITSTAVYVLDKSLTVINSAGKVLPECNVTSVRFEGNYARFFENNGRTSAAVLDLAAAPPSLIQSPIVSSAYLYSYSDDKLMGVGESENGGMTLTMYDSESGIALGNISFAENDGEIFSKVFSDRRAALVDPESGIIGIPVYSHTEFGTKNSYYVFSYSEENGFSSKGMIEYLDIDDSFCFDRGELYGGNIYIISKGRIISARISDLNVIGVYEY